MLRNQPPESFLEKFQDTYALCHENYKDVLLDAEASGDGACIAELIREILSGIVLLAGESASINARYAANVMVFYRLEAVDVTAVADRIRFVEPEVKEGGLRGLRGVLDLALELSTSSDAPAEVDPKLRPLSLPIPLESMSKDERRSRILPGAPLAFHRKALDAYQDTGSLGDWCRKEGDFSESVAAELDAYFRDRASSSIRSLVSLPIGGGCGDEPIAVLNLHSNRAGLFAEEKALRHFWNLAYPFCAMLADLLQKHKDLEVSNRLKAQ